MSPFLKRRCDRTLGVGRGRARGAAGGGRTAASAVAALQGLPGVKIMQSNAVLPPPDSHAAAMRLEMRLEMRILHDANNSICITHYRRTYEFIISGPDRP